MARRQVSAKSSRARGGGGGPPCRSCIADRMYPPRRHRPAGRDRASYQRYPKSSTSSAINHGERYPGQDGGCELVNEIGMFTPSLARSTPMKRFSSGHGSRRLGDSCCSPRAAPSAAIAARPTATQATTATQAQAATPAGTPTMATTAWSAPAGSGCYCRCRRAARTLPRPSRTSPRSGTCRWATEPARVRSGRRTGSPRS